MTTRVAVLGSGTWGTAFAMILADAGWKYLSADFWDAEDVEQAMERTVWW